MGYYDNVKNSIKDEGSQNTSSSTGSNFDTLKQAAEEDSNSEEEKKDDTPIEVLEEGGLNKRSQSNKSNNTNQTSKEVSNEKTVVQDNSNIEKKLDKLIEQNEEIIEVLRSFGS